MKAKIILVLTYPDHYSPQKIDGAQHQLARAAKRWALRADDPVLGLTLPEECSLKAYAVPEEALVELPEIVVKVEPAEPENVEGVPCNCEAMAENLYEPGKPRWRPTVSEPHHPDCPRAALLEDGQLPHA